MCLHTENRFLEEQVSDLRFGAKPIVSFSPGTEIWAMYTAGFSGKLRLTRNESDKLGWLGNSSLLPSTSSFTCLRNCGILLKKKKLNKSMRKQCILRWDDVTMPPESWSSWTRKPRWRSREQSNIKLSVPRSTVVSLLWWPPRHWQPWGPATSVCGVGNPAQKNLFWEYTCLSSIYPSGQFKISFKPWKWYSSPFHCSFAF